MGKESHYCHKVTKWSHHRSLSQHMTGNMRTMESEVYSHSSSCIYNVENQMGTLSSSPCQLRLGVDLSCHS